MKSHLTMEDPYRCVTGVCFTNILKRKGYMNSYYFLENAAREIEIDLCNIPRFVKEYVTVRASKHTYYALVLIVVSIGVE